MGWRARGPRSASRVLDLLRPRRAGRRAHRPLSARILRRPAPAHRHRPRAVGRSGAGDRRRAGVGARRVDPGADPEPVPRPAGGVRADLPVHRPRSQRHPPHQRPGGGDVCRQDRRDRAGGRAVRGAAASLHQGAAGGGARGRSRPSRRRGSPCRARCRRRSTRRRAAGCAGAARGETTVCSEIAPPLVDVGDGRQVACHNL